MGLTFKATDARIHFWEESMQEDPEKIADVSLHQRWKLMVENEWLKADRDEYRRLWIASLGERNKLSGLLQELIDIEGPQPGTSEWAAKVRAAVIRPEGA